MSSHKLVHVIDDDVSIRRSVSYALRTAGYAVQTWDSGSGFLKDIRDVEKGCILLDIRMPDVDGLQIQQMLAERGVSMPIVIMTGHGEIGLAVKAMKAGAIDFLEKPFKQAALLSAVEAAFDKLAKANDIVARAAEADLIVGALTPRERDVLEGLAQGLPNKTIAHDLGISSRTVEVHRSNLMAKLDVRSLADALRIAFAAGLGADA